MKAIYSRQRKEYECWIFLSTGKVLRTYCESLTLKNVKACSFCIQKIGMTTAKYVLGLTRPKCNDSNLPSVTDGRMA